MVAMNIISLSKTVFWENVTTIPKPYNILRLTPVKKCDFQVKAVRQVHTIRAVFSVTMDF